MEINKSETIQLFISYQRSIEELKSSIQAIGKIEGISIKVSDRMEASLYGHAFNIQAITPNEQPITSKRTTSWRWEVTPKEEGLQKLYLSLTAIFEVNGKDTKMSVKTFEKIIEIKVTTKKKFLQFISDNWQWLWTTIVVPIGLGLLEIEKK